MCSHWVKAVVGGTIERIFYNEDDPDVIPDVDFQIRGEEEALN